MNDTPHRCDIAQTHDALHRQTIELREGESLVEKIDTLLDRKLERADKGSSPIVQAEVDMGKTVVTLSLAALAFSITVAQFVVGHTPPLFPVLLPASWVLFCVASVCALLRQAYTGQAQSQRAELERIRNEVLGEIAGISHEANATELATAVVSRALAKAGEPATRAIRILGKLNGYMLAGFLGGIAAFLLFVMANEKL